MHHHAPTRNLHIQITKVLLMGKSHLIYVSVDQRVSIRVLCTVFERFNN